MNSKTLQSFFILSLILMAFNPSGLHSQNIEFPDAKFKEALLDKGIDTDGDGQISNAEAEVVTYLEVHNDITDMTGIEAFVNLDTLKCNGLWILELRPNYIVNLDVSKNLELRYLDCGYNPLGKLEIGNNTKLSYLFCMFTELNTLDISGCTNLDTLVIGGNFITSLNLSNNRKLNLVYISEMETLSEVLVWTLPFPTPELELISDGSPFIYYKDVVEPELSILNEISFKVSNVEVLSTEEGKVYAVPVGTERNLSAIREACIDSVNVMANTAAKIHARRLGFGTNWFYAADLGENISEPKSFSIFGTGIDKANSDLFKIYPNPVEDFLIIGYKGTGTYSIEITSLNAKLVYENHFEGNSQQIDLSSLQAGIYIVNIYSADFISTEKIIKY